MPIERKLGRKCKYTETCSKYHGNGIPENMTLTIWRNVFCNRGEKGWSNCEEYLKREKEKTAH